MKQAYIKPVLFQGKEPEGLIPVVAAIATIFGISQAVAGLALGAAATGAAVAGGTALAKKAGNDYCRWGRLPAMDGVESYA